MPELVLYYDDDCPICKYYTMFLKIRKTHKLIFKDIRQSDEIKQICENNKININDGMILITEKNDVLQGELAVIYLKNIDMNTNIFYKFLFSKYFIKFTYPVLKFLRFILLKLLKKQTKF